MKTSQETISEMYGTKPRYARHHVIEMMEEYADQFRPKWIGIDENSLPKNGTDVILCFLNSAGKHIGEATFKDDAFYYCAETNNGYYEEIIPMPLNWMAMPQLPE